MVAESLVARHEDVDEEGVAEGEAAVVEVAHFSETTMKMTVMMTQMTTVEVVVALHGLVEVLEGPGEEGRHEVFEEGLQVADGRTGGPEIRQLPLRNVSARTVNSVSCDPLVCR